MRDLILQLSKSSIYSTKLANSNEEVKVIPFNPGERALRRLRRKGRDFRGLSGGSLLLTLRGMFINYFSDTRELNTVAAKP